jgi:hypothetical protein
MSEYPNFDALQSIATHNPPSWRMLRKIPRPALLRYDSDENGQDVFTLNRRNFRSLCICVGHILHGAEDRDGPVADWLEHNGRNLFDAPDTESAARIAAALTTGSTGTFSAGTDRPLMDVYVLALWTARQHDLIDADTWGACFMAAWVGRNSSIHLDIDLSGSETTAMFDAMGTNGGFYWNRKIKTRRKLPKTVRLYRGIASDITPCGFLGYSWTDDLEVARRFAVFRNLQGYGRVQVFSAIFNKADIAAVFEHERGPGDGAPYREWLVYPDATPQNLETVRLLNPIERMLAASPFAA